MLDRRETSLPGPFNPDVTPYTIAITDALGDPYVEEVTFVGSTQIGKTRTPLNAVCYWIDNKPGDVLWVLPDEKVAGRFARRRFKPMLQDKAMRFLQKYRTGRARDENKTEVTLTNCTISFVWSNSAAALASFPLPYVIFDEVDKFPLQLKNEADPISLGKERTAWYWYRKILKLSSPTIPDSPIDREWKDSIQHLYYVPCPLCGAFQELFFGDGKEPGGIKIEGGVKDPDQIAAHQLAYYECLHCRGRWDEPMKNVAVRNGQWRRADGQPYQPALHVGFRINALYSPVRSLSAVMAKFLTVKDDPIKLRNFKNSWLAENFEDVKSAPVKIGTYLSNAATAQRRRGQLPDNLLMLTGGIDRHGDLKGHYWSVWAWTRDGHRHLVDWGIIRGDEDVPALVSREWKDRNGQPVRCLWGMDSRWDPESAYKICRLKYPVTMPTMGEGEISGPVWIREAPVDYTGRRGSRYTGFNRLDYDNKLFKDSLFGRLANTDAPEIHFPADDGTEDRLGAVGLAQFIDTFKSEKLVKETNGVYRWKKTYEHAPNHFLDTSLIAHARAEREGLARKIAFEEKRIRTEPPQPRQAVTDRTQQPNRANDITESFRRH